MIRKLLALGGVIALVGACSTETVQKEAEFETPQNFTLNYELRNQADSSYQGNAYYKLFTEVFQGRNCAGGGCHDGSFEPDFRTLYSSYNTLVYHDVVKNNAEQSFEYRVKPYEPDSSWLVERVTTDDAVLGRMPLYSEALSDEHVTMIRDWIAGGCEDEFGNKPFLPNPEPTFFGILAYLNNNEGEELSYTRGEEFFYPLNLPNNSTIEFWFGFYDNEPDGSFVLGAELGYNKYQISGDLYDFSQAPEQDLNVLPLATPFMGPILGSTEQGPYYHSFTLETGEYTPGQVYGVRVLIQGKDNEEVSIFPDDDAQIFLKTLFSFTVVE